MRFSSLAVVGAVLVSSAASMNVTVACETKIITLVKVLHDNHHHNGTSNNATLANKVLVNALDKMPIPNAAARSYPEPKRAALQRKFAEAHVNATWGRLASSLLKLPDAYAELTTFTNEQLNPLVKIYMGMLLARLADVVEQEKKDQAKMDDFANCLEGALMTNTDFWCVQRDREGDPAFLGH